MKTTAKSVSREEDDRYFFAIAEIYKFKTRLPFKAMSDICILIRVGSSQIILSFGPDLVVLAKLGLSSDMANLVC